MLPRTGWLLAGIAQPESVAEHSWATALLALGLAMEINNRFERDESAVSLDVGRVVQIALVHDLAEATLTDLPRRATEVLGETVKHAAEERALAALLGKAEAADTVLALWQEYASSASPEAKVVRDADKLEMVYQAYRYEGAGHRTLDEFWEGHRWHFAVSAHVFTVLSRARHAYDPLTDEHGKAVRGKEPK